MCYMSPNWDAVSAVATCATTLAIAVAWWQLRADHERSTALAIDLLRHWCIDLSQRASVARRLAETLDDEQSRLLSTRKAVSVPRASGWMLRVALPPDLQWKQPDGDGPIVVPEDVATALRWEVVTYLNRLESVLAAWQHGVADQEIIEQQFAYLVSPREGHYALEKFRRAEGEEHYPAIKAFVDWLRTQQTIPRRPPPA